MKPSQEQKDLITAISKEIAGWANTNDIDSSSHWNLIEEFCESLELSVLHTAKLNDCLSDIMTIIKQTK
jgi:hypothetical protein